MKPLSPTILDPNPDDFGMYDEDPYYGGAQRRAMGEEYDEEEAEPEIEVREILGGTGKIIIDTFGYYIPPEKPKPPEFPRPLTLEEIEKAKEQERLAKEAELEGEGGFAMGPGQPAPIPTLGAPADTQVAVPGAPPRASTLKRTTLQRGGPTEPPFAFDDARFFRGEEEGYPEELGEDEEGLMEGGALDQPEEFKKQIVKRYTIINSRGTSISIIEYGATITSIKVQDKDGASADIVLGFDNMEGYQSEENQSLGGTLGRFSAIITDGTFKIGSREYYVTQNEGQHHVLGGTYGFDKVMWDSSVYKDKVVMTYVSKDNEEGYPGNIMVQTSFSLTRNNIFVVQTQAYCSKPTIVSIANNIMFNLAGHGAGPEGLKQHSLIVNADRFIVRDDLTGYPTGEIENVGATYFDLRVPRPLARAMRKVPGYGYDHTFCLTKAIKRRSVSFAGRLVHPENGRYLEIETDQPGLHVYTCNKLPNPDPTFIEVATPEEPDYKCRMEFGEDGDGWPMRVLSKQIWERPLSVPEEEHLFIEELEEGTTRDGEEEVIEAAESASVYEIEGETERGYGMFDPEELYRDEGESLFEEEEGAEMIGEKLLEGKSGAMYRDRGAIVLMPQEYPDSPKYKTFPSPVLEPSKVYSRTTTYRFGIIPIAKPEELAKIVA